MPEPPVLLTRDGPVARIALNRPERRNAVDDAACAALGAAVAAARAAEDCRVIVLSGVGPVFCAGWDLKAIAQTRERRDPEATRAGFEANRRILDELRRVPQVVVALAHGAALGFGISLLARADIVLAQRSTRFALPEIGVGIVPALVMLELRRFPAKVALDWLLTGESRTAGDAQRAGLVTRVVEDGELDAAGAQLVERLAGHDGATLLASKALYRRLGELDEERGTAEAIDVAVRALVQHTV